MADPRFPSRAAQILDQRGITGLETAIILIAFVAPIVDIVDGRALIDDAHAIVRTTRVRQPREYLSRAADRRVVETREIPVGDLPFEYMLNALRLVGGFGEAEFEARTGLPFATLAGTIAVARQKGWLEQDRPAHWRPTEIGQRFLNDLQALFLPENPLRGESNTVNVNE